MTATTTVLEGLIDEDELREQIIERAAQKAIDRWQPPKGEEERTRFDEDLQKQVDHKVQAEILSAMQGPIALAIDNALEGEFQPTNAYGDPRSGPKRTLREIIATRVEEQIKLPENRSGYENQRRDTALSEWLATEVQAKVRKQLWADFASIADAVTESAATAIKSNMEYLIKNRTKR